MQMFTLFLFLNRPFIFVHEYKKCTLKCREMLNSHKCCVKFYNGCFMKYVLFQRKSGCFQAIYRVNSVALRVISNAKKHRKNIRRVLLEHIPPLSRKNTKQVKIHSIYIIAPHINSNYGGGNLFRSCREELELCEIDITILC